MFYSLLNPSYIIHAVFQVAAVFVCFLVLLVRVGPMWSQAFLGYVPDKSLFHRQPDALYTGNLRFTDNISPDANTCPAVGILGATVMPHALFLGSYLATQDRIGPELTLPSPQSAPPSGFRDKARAWLRSIFEVSRAERRAAARDYRDKYGRENNDLSFVRAHLTHGLVDVIFSLLAVAVPINSA